MKKGTLFLIPTFLSEDYTDVLPFGHLEIVRRLDEFIVEEPKTARHFLKKVGSLHTLQSIQMHTLNEHTDSRDVFTYLQSARDGKDIGLMSEAGCPGIADPGSLVVRYAHQSGIQVKPLIGPSSILLALMASGLNGQSFTFHGYLPRETAQRKKKILELEKDAVKKSQSQLFIETPYRNKQLLQDIITVCNEDTLLCIAMNLTSSSETIHTMKIRDWKKLQFQPEKIPAIFILGS